MLLNLFSNKNLKDIQFKRNYVISSIVSNTTIQDTSKSVSSNIEKTTPPTIGIVKSVQDGIVRVKGLHQVKAGEMVIFQKSQLKGMALNLDKTEVGIVLFGNDRLVKQGEKVFGLDTTVKVNPKGVLGTVVDGIGDPIEKVLKKKKYPNLLLNKFESKKSSQLVEKKAPGIIARQSVCEPLYTGIKTIDLLFPIGRGQRELIIGDRQIGKTTIAIDTILNQKQVQQKHVENLSLLFEILGFLHRKAIDSYVFIAAVENTKNINKKYLRSVIQLQLSLKTISNESVISVQKSTAIFLIKIFVKISRFLTKGIAAFFFSEIVYCYYVAVGQKRSRVVHIRKMLKDKGCLFYSTLVLAGASDPAPMQYIASYTGVALAEFWRDRGMHSLIIYDDLSKQAVAYRQISLLLRRPPGREAFPGDVFYLHSRLLERAAKISKALGSGSLTALPIVETYDGDLSSYIPTNVISITDGQIFLEGKLFRQGLRPAISVRLSVSRVGSAAQSKGLKDVIRTLKFEIAQFREIETFALFGSELEEDLALLLERGQKITRLLNQPPNVPVSSFIQLFLIILIQSAMFDELRLTDVNIFELQFIKHVNNICTNPWIFSSFKYMRSLLADRAVNESRAYLNLFLYETLTIGQGTGCLMPNVLENFDFTSTKQGSTLIYSTQRLEEIFFKTRYGLESTTVDNIFYDDKKYHFYNYGSNSFLNNFDSTFITTGESDESDSQLLLAIESFLKDDGKEDGLSLYTTTINFICKTVFNGWCLFEEEFQSKKLLFQFLISKFGRSKKSKRSVITNIKTNDFCLYVEKYKGGSASNFLKNKNTFFSWAEKKVILDAKVLKFVNFQLHTKWMPTASEKYIPHNSAETQIPTKLITFLDSLSSNHLWLNLVLVHYILKERSEGINFKLSTKDKLLVRMFFNIYIKDFINSRA